MNRSILTFFTGFLALFVLPAAAFSAPVPQSAKAKLYAKVQGEDVLVAIEVTPDFECWFYDDGPGEVGGVATTITIEGVDDADWEVWFPEPKVKYDASIDWTSKIFDKKTVLYGIARGMGEDADVPDITAQVTGQVCNKSTCVPWEPLLEFRSEGTDELWAGFPPAFLAGEVDEPVEVEDPAAEASTAEGTSDTQTGDDAPIVNEGDGEGASDEGTAAAATTSQKKEYGQDATTDGGLLKFILLAIGAGLFTLLMPCTYPMIPITISYFTKQAESRGGKVLPLALAYGAGIVVIFVLLGVLAGPVMGAVAGHPITNVVIGIVFVVFALALFGMIDLSPPAFMMKFAGNASSTGGYLGVFMMGLTLVVTSFTCTGPFVGSLLAAGSEQGVVHVALGMGAFGLTMATPFVFLALIPGKVSSMPSAGAWMNTLKVFMGFVELAASLKFFSNADIALDLMILPREVFLILWAGIAFIAGMYLLGRINLKGESPDGNIGPGRLVGATVTILGGFYCLLGTMGYQLDGVIMSAMAPPPSYTRGLVESHRPAMGVGEVQAALPAGAKFEGGSIVVKDDYDLARELAEERGLGLIVNFTAHT